MEAAGLEVKTMRVHAQGKLVELAYTDEARPTGFSTFLASALTVRTGDDLACDLGTGSGLLAIVLASMGVGKVVAIDRSEAACALALENVRANGVGDRVEVVHADLGEFRPSRRFDLVVSNPPTMPSGRDTPAFAASGGDAGPSFVELLTEGLPAWLSRSGSAQLALSSLVDEPLVAGLRAGGFEVEPRTSLVLPFRDFYFSSYDEGQLREFVARGQAIHRAGASGGEELSELVTVYQLSRRAEPG